MRLPPKSIMRPCTLFRLIALLVVSTVSVPFASAASTPSASAADYPTLQDAIDANPGRMVFIPAGDYLIDRAVRITTPNAGLWGPGRIIQSNPEAAIVDVRGASGAQVRDVTLTRAAGKQDTTQSGLSMVNSPNATISNVSVIDNWSAKASIFVDGCDRVQIRECTVRDYSCISIDDRTQPATNSGVVYGYAFRCTNGTGINVLRTRGALIQSNRVIEHRLLPTPEIKEKYQLGTFVKKNKEKSPLVSQENWDSNYVNIWRQGSAIHIGSGKTSDYILIIGNYIENAQQGIDIQADHVTLANNIVNDAPHGMKATHGSRNTLISGNQFTKNDLWGIGLMPGAAAHVAGQLPNKGPSPVGENVAGYSIVANNIISDFGFGLSHWLWPVGHGIGPAPIQLGGNALPDTPVLRDVLVIGNLVYDVGRDGIVVDGKPKIEPPRYRYTIRVHGGAQAPENLQFYNNLFDEGLDGLFSNDKEKAPIQPEENP